MAKSDCNVVIMHGHGDAWKTVQKFVKKAGYRPRVLMLEPGGGTIFNRLRDIIWGDVHCAVIVLSGDDPGIEGKRRARQNVVFELGYCYGAFDSLDKERDGFEAEDVVIVVAEAGLELFSDIHGLRTVEFEQGRIADIEKQFRMHLDHAFESGKEYYGLG
jgi:predicted nucleotide-binding protein